MNIYLINQSDSALYKVGITKKRPKYQTEGIINSKSPSSTYSLQNTNSSLKQLHAHYKLNQINSEWFELSDEQVSLFIDVCTKLESAFDVLKQYNNPFI